MSVESYRDLKVWQKAMRLAEDVYHVTESFPKSELYGLTSQIRRSVVSVASNIAEGSARRSTREFIRFINIASGSLAEVETQLILSQRLTYLQEDQLTFLLSQCDEVGKMLFALQKSLQERLQPLPEPLDSIL